MNNLAGIMVEYFMNQPRKTNIPPESQTVEWKQSLSEWKEIVETCAAFASAQGGSIHIGITPRGERIGVQLGHGSIEDLINKVKVNTDPPQFPSVAVHGPEKSAVIELSVEQNPVKPVWAFGRPVLRVGCTNQHLRRDELQRLVDVTTGRSWDAMICHHFTVKQVDRNAVRDYLEHAGMNLTTPFEDILRNIRMPLARSGYCNAVVLLFAKCPQQFYVEAQLKCARFKGINSVDFEDEQTIEGPILYQLDQAMNFVGRNTRRAYRITGKPQREVIPEYPEAAVREAIVNALTHRNYADVGTIQVRIYDDRLEVWNPGHLSSQLTLRELYSQHVSHPGNPLVAQALYRAGLIEHWGTGTLRIIRACRKNHIAVHFETKMGCFIVTLKKKERIPVTMVQPDTGQVTGRIAGQPESRPESQPESMESRVLRILQSGPVGKRELSAGLRQKEISGQLNKVVRILLSNKAIEMTIPGKPNSRLQKYRLTKKGITYLKRQVSNR